MVESRGDWITLFGAALGAGMGISALLTYNAGLFVFELGRSIGLSRTSFGVSFFLTTLVVAMTLPLVGWRSIAGVPG
jgi:hypothetical protein